MRFVKAPNGLVLRATGSPQNALVLRRGVAYELPPLQESKKAREVPSA